MGTTYTRRINLYINGREVSNYIASIRAGACKVDSAAWAYDTGEQGV